MNVLFSKWGCSSINGPAFIKCSGQHSVERQSNNQCSCTDSIDIWAILKAVSGSPTLICVVRSKQYENGTLPACQQNNVSRRRALKRRSKQQNSSAFYFLAACQRCRLSYSKSSTKNIIPLIQHRGFGPETDLGFPDSKSGNGIS